MSDDQHRFEGGPGRARRRRWTIEEKLRIVDETLRCRDSIAAVARRHGVAPTLLYRWRSTMAARAPAPGRGAARAAAFRRLDERIREFERQISRKMLEMKCLRRPLAGPGSKRPVKPARAPRAPGRDTPTAPPAET